MRTTSPTIRFLLVLAHLYDGNKDEKTFLYHFFHQADTRFWTNMNLLLRLVSLNTPCGTSMVDLPDNKRWLGVNGGAQDGSSESLGPNGLEFMICLASLQNVWSSPNVIFCADCMIVSRALFVFLTKASAMPL